MFEGQKCLVVGAGLSGIGAAVLLKDLGAEVVLFDGDEKADASAVWEKLPDSTVASVYTGELPEEVMQEQFLAVLSPGVPVDSPLADRLRKNGVTILGEMELGYLAEKGRVIAITGTNGKTTTTTLVGEIMKAHYTDAKVFVVGNIGNSYTRSVMKTAGDTVTVAELSSFQLETVHTFRPSVSAILNITPDHLNRHHTMEAYIEAKEAIAGNQGPGDVCVLNYDNIHTRDFGKRCPARVIYFSVKETLAEGYFLKEDHIYKREAGIESCLLHITKDMNLVGLCNVENCMAAIAIADSMQVPFSVTKRVIKHFKAVEHRIEYVATKGGVNYYNDSKGTNPDAAIQGIRAMSRPTVLIAGGYDKESDYTEWIESFEDKVTHLVLIGQTREKIAACARTHGISNIHLADSFDECLLLSTELAREGDAVLLSPACASWGMFPSYEVRGKIFKDYVNNLKE